MTATLLIQGVQQFFDTDGNPLAMGKVYFYVPGTSTLKDIWQDAAQTTPNTNPVVLDSGGRAIIYGSGAYRQVIKDVDDNTLFDAVTQDVFGLVMATEASEDDIGVVQFATQAEVDAGVLDNKVLSPETLANSSLLDIDPGLPRSYLAGLGLANNSGDPNNDIDFAVGECRDVTNTVDMVLAAALTKQLDAAWAVGTNQGGLDTGAKANSTWYHCFIIKRSDTGVVDALFSASATAPTMPASYDYARRIGAILTDGSGNIIAFSQNGDEFLVAPSSQLSAAVGGTAANTLTLDVPSGVVVNALISASIYSTPGTATRILFSSLAVADTAPSTTLFDIAVYGAAGIGSTTYKSIRTNTSSQIRWRASVAAGTLEVMLQGWLDRRGQDA